MALVQIAQGGSASGDLAWYELQITGVAVGAAIAALVALAVAWMNRRQARSTRWDDARRATYTGFLSADLELYEADRASSDALLKWLRAQPGPDRTDAASREVAARERLEAAQRAMKTRTAEVLTFGSGPVCDAADALTKRTTEAGRAYFEMEKSHDHANLHAQTPALTATYQAADEVRKAATTAFLSVVRKGLQTG